MIETAEKLRDSLCELVMQTNAEFSRASAAADRQQKAAEAECAAHKGVIELVIEPKLADLGEFSVRRALPSSQRRKVGPFVFFDHMGPATFPPGQGIDVRPHPHIGIATVTYLFEGEILHRDSLGYEQAIRPGDVITTGWV